MSLLRREAAWTVRCGPKRHLSDRTLAGRHAGGWDPAVATARERGESLMSQGTDATCLGSAVLFTVALTAALSGCATGHYVPLASAEKGHVAQLRENIYRLEYRVSPFTPQARLDDYVRRRAAELTLREGYDYFHLSQQADVLALTKQTSITVTMYKGRRDAGVADLYDAREIVRRAEQAASAD